MNAVPHAVRWLRGGLAMTEPWCIYCEALVDPYSHCPKRGVHKIVGERERVRQPVSRHVRGEARLAPRRQRRRGKRRG